jgi:SAM-dependent methyltransferase
MLDESAPAAQEPLESILARLHAEVERTGSGSGGDAGGGDFVLLRHQAERLWPVSAERPFLSRIGAWGRVRGLLLVPVKATLRKLMRWYVEPLAADQRRFNGAILKLVDALSQQTDERLGPLPPKIEEQARAAVELEERLTRLERRERSGAAPVAAPLPAVPERVPAVFPDYFAYESRMRGPTDSVREKQRPYVEDFREAEPVLDLGCGRGEFLGLLREAGIEARGVDADADMVAYCRGEGLDVERADAVEYLEGLEDGSLGGIMAAQVVEHLPAPTMVRLLELAAGKLRAGGLLVAETINPLSPLALRNYFADLTHAQPLVPETLELLARQAGFSSVEVRFLNEPERQLAEPEDPTVAANVRRLNELLFGPLDYAVLARR